MKYYILFFSLCVGFFVHVQARLQGEGIIGGTDAKRGEFKYQISLENEKNNICGGGIISDQYVLTAAHCVIDSSAKFKDAPLTVLAAALKARTRDDPEAIRIEVERIYVLYEFMPFNPRPGTFYRTTADLAVLKLKRGLGIKTNPLLSALQLPESVNQFYANQPTVIAGFGDNWINIHVDKNSGAKIEFGGGSNDTLRYAKAYVMDNSDCMQFFDAPIYPSHVCAAVVQHDPNFEEGVCSGDSGSPLVHNDKTVIGILSSSPFGCTEAESPAVYTRVSSYVSFVKNVLKDKITSDVRVAVLTDYRSPNNETVQMYNEITPRRKLG